MKFDPWASLQEFFEAYGIPVGESDTIELAATLQAEEIQERSEALDNLNQCTPGTDEWHEAMAEYFAETADVIYVMCFDAYARGVDLGAVLDTIHMANMTKVWPDGQIHKDPETGKVLKPPTWEKPDFRALLAESARAA